MENVKVAAKMWMIVSQGEWTGAINVYLVGPRILVLGRDLVEEVLIVRGAVHGSVSRTDTCDPLRAPYNPEGPGASYNLDQVDQVDLIARRSPLLMFHRLLVMRLKLDDCILQFYIFNFF